MRPLLILTLALISMTNAYAEDLFAKGDVKAGKSLHDKTCISCHVSRVGDDGSAVYTRPDHKVTTQQLLRAQIGRCNANANAGWFPEEELHVGAYLNKQFYHLTK